MSTVIFVELDLAKRGQRSSSSGGHRLESWLMLAEQLSPNSPYLTPFYQHSLDGLPDGSRSLPEAFCSAGASPVNRLHRSRKVSL